VIKKRQTILVTEDAPEIMEQIVDALAGEGFAVVKATNVQELRAALLWARPDLILLDVNLPDGDGLDIACKMRLRERAGLIFVTARDGEEDRLKGLESGGDDYVIKPFSVRELTARVHNVLRLRAPASSQIRFDGWSLDMIRRELFQPNGALLPLTTGEFNVLAALAAVRPQPLTRDFLLDVISNRDPRTVRAHTVDTLVARLRRKLDSGVGSGPVIVTVRGVGYALAGDASFGDR